VLSNFKKKTVLFFLAWTLQKCRPIGLQVISFGSTAADAACTAGRMVIKVDRRSSLIAQRANQAGLSGLTEDLQDA
jgi:hypothetical protein